MQAAPLDDLRRQVESSQVEQAWRTAQDNPQLIGQPEFDFLYGLAALNAGRVAEGVLALERHLAAAPGNDRARLELARGYFLLGEYPRARSEFDFLLRSKPPAGVRANIDSYLQAMLLRDNSSNISSARFYAEIGGGYDNNVTLGTFHETVGGGGIPPHEASQIGDWYGQLAIGGQHQMRVSSRLTLLLGADLDQRPNLHEHAFDLTTGSAYAGFTNLHAWGLWRLTLGASELRIGSRRYRDQLQFAGELNTNLNPNLSLLSFAQYAELRHAAADQKRDGRSTTVGAMLTQSLPDIAGQPSFGARLSFVQEDNLRRNLNLSKKTGILKVFAAVDFLDRTRLALSATATRDDYLEPAFQEPEARSDHTVSVDGSAAYAMNRFWSVRMEGSWLQTRSNQLLFDKRRKTAALKLRYQF